jgi:serine/threonine protein phosphatase PrpC
MAIKFETAELTDKGRVRDENEDTVFHKVFYAPDDAPLGLFVVADGIGGRLAGQMASYWAVEVVKNNLADLIAYQDPRSTNRFSREDVLRMMSTAEGVDPSTLQERVRESVDRANRAVRQYALHSPQAAHNAGTTLCLALVYGRQAIIANVGDSRAYVLRAGRLRQITTDHSVVQQMVDAGQLRADMIYTHPQRNVIYRSLGARDTVETDIFTLTLQAGDYVLLCSDGLWEMVRDDDALAHIISQAASVQAACQQLVDAANAAGGKDNIAVVLARIHE